MTLSPSEKALVAHLLQLPTVERDAALERMCAETPELRERRSTLAEAVAVGVRTQNLSSLPSNDGAARVFEFALESEREDVSGAKIGPYKLLQKIGEGGFGAVWMAEQQEPIRRRVAVKIIKLGMDTEEVITRFEVERQALALMDHPNIARVFDAGATAAGRPYFVMELVRGIAITRYCDDNKMPAEARLRLFIAVCQAVQHAHQKGIIHRDLKPSNILVTLHDGQPVPKIIDFGIAKATDQQLTDKTLFTRFHSFIGTPAYTSPEQMEMSGLDIDTRSDIYSLGVLLYELLTSHLPFDAAALLKSGLDAMRRTIREVDPPRPSTRLGTLSDNDRTDVAQRRGTDAAKLSLLLRGDLDWVVMRCLEKDRTRRYETANALARDVERHLANELVTARPPSQLYRLQKLFHRHRLAVIATSAVAISLVAGFVASTVLFVRERNAHGRAVLAEQGQSVLRQQAEAARTLEIKRAARTALELAERNLAEGRIADGLAYLVDAARKDPSNPVLAPRLASVLAMNNFLLPEGPPFECGSRVVALHYALDGRTFLAGTEDGTLRVFETATGKLSREFRIGKAVLLAGGWLFASANDRIFAARFSDNTLAIFDAATGRSQGAAIQLDPSIFPSGIDQVGLSPNGRWVGGFSYTLRTFWLWDALTGEKRLESQFESGVVKDFDFSADGGRLCVVGGNEVRLWSLPDCLPSLPPIAVERPPGASNNIGLYARFASDSRRLAILDTEAGVRLCDATTGAWLGPVIKTSGGIGRYSWEFVPDGRLLRAVGGSTEIRDLETGRVTQLPNISRGGYWEKEFSRDGSLLLTTAPEDGRGRLWDTTTGQSAAEFTLPPQPSIRGALSPDGTQIVVGSSQGSVHRLRIDRRSARPLIFPRQLPAVPLAFLPEPPARLLWLTAERARVLDVASGREVAPGFVFPHRLTENAPGEGSTRPPLRADLKFLVVRNGPGWEAWELSAAGPVRVVVLQGEIPANGSIIFGPTGELAAIASTTRIQVWNLRTGAVLGPAISVNRPVPPSSINFSPDGLRLAAPFSGAPSIWDIATGQPATGTFTPTADMTLSAVQFSPDGTRIVTADRKGEARLWDAAGAPLSPILYHPDGLTNASFSPDGRYFVTRSSSEARLWDARTAAPVGEPIALPVGRDLRFSPDSRRMITASEDGKVRIFDLRTGQTFSEPLDHGTLRLPTAWFSPDSLFVRTETTAPDLRIWSVPPALPDGTPPPEWLLQLGTACAGKIVNDQGQLAAITDTAGRIAKLRTEIAALPATAPLSIWGRWIVNERADRSIAPGFTLTPAEADQLTASLAAVLPSKP